MNIKMFSDGALISGLFFVFALFQSVSAQTEDARQIEFGSGKVSKIVRAKMKAADNVHDYTVRVRAGQVMLVGLISKSQRAYFSIICPGCTQIGDTPFGMKEAYKTRRWLSVIPDTGDYTIRVATDKPAVFAYALEITIRDRNLLLENPPLIKRWTGNYAARNGSNLDAQLLPNGDLKFRLTAFWKSPTNRELIHDGEISGVAPMRSNLAIYEKGKCKILLEFLPGKVNVLQTGGEADCDFGANVNAAGTYRKKNSDAPVFDF